MSRARRERRKKLPKYAKAVVDKGLQALDAGAMRPGLYTIVVRHDDWCNLLTGKGECNCNPEVGAPEPYNTPPACPYREEEYAARAQRGPKATAEHEAAQAEFIRTMEECGRRGDKGEELAQLVLRRSAVEAVGATHEDVDRLPTWMDVVELILHRLGLRRD